MSVDHATLVMLAKSLGLLCFVVASGLVLYYALRPSARDGFERAASSIIDDGGDVPAKDVPARDVPMASVSPSADASEDDGPVPAVTDDDGGTRGRT